MLSLPIVAFREGEYDKSVEGSPCLFKSETLDLIQTWNFEF